MPGTTRHKAHAGSDHHSSRIKNARPFKGRVNWALPNASEEVRTALRDSFAKHGGMPTMCPLCGESLRTATGGHSPRPHDPITGACGGKATVACGKRRAQLDDETIEFLGLVPRKE